MQCKHCDSKPNWPAISLLLPGNNLENTWHSMLSEKWEPWTKIARFFTILFIINVWYVTWQTTTQIVLLHQIVGSNVLFWSNWLFPHNYRVYSWPCYLLCRELNYVLKVKFSLINKVENLFLKRMLMYYTWCSIVLYYEYVELPVGVNDAQ